MLFNRLLTADWLLEIKTERGGDEEISKQRNGMKTHEIGISSFASVMINGKEKH